MSERYEVLGQIAEGGLGTVSRARDRQSGQEVALKRLRTDRPAGLGSGADALLQEARQQARVRHPAVAVVHEADVDAHGSFIAMELIQGETLEYTVQRAALTGPEFDLLARQSLEGMAAVHRAGLLHLDLQPENLMLQPLSGGGFRVKILDFGLAQNLSAAPGARAPCGSVYFMAPELFENTCLDVRTDIYSLGCVFYYALTQKPPFDGETSPQVIVAHRYHRLRPLESLRPDLPASLTQWVERLMSRQPADRPDSMEMALQCYQAMAHPPF